MTEKELYELMGVECASPAAADENGNVLEGGYGIVSYCGEIGYYDDDEWLPNDDKEFEALSEEFVDNATGEEMDKYGTTYGIVYFGKPFKGEMRTIPHGDMKPASMAECLHYLSVLIDKEPGKA